MNKNTTPLLELNCVTARSFEKETLRNISLTIYEGEQWALLGDSDSGKNAFLEALYGKIAITNGEINLFFANDYIATAPSGILRNANDLIASLSFKHHFKNRANIQQFYYQQRYNSFEAEESISVIEYLASIKTARPAPYWTIEKVLTLFNLNALVDKPCIALSNGESRRLMLAVTLLKNPALLLLDHPMVGLDVQTRENFDIIIDQIIASGIQIIMATSPHEVPSAINRIAIFENGQLLEKGNRSIVHTKSLAFYGGTQNNISQLVKDLLSAAPKIQSFETIIGMRDVHVKYGDKMILENIDWEVKQGEHWVLSGHNGAGKSTLLSLITADNPQAYANAIVLFDRRRGSGESIWEIKKKIGFVSPELHQYFSTSQSCLQVVCSGFFDTIGLFKACSADQVLLAEKWMEALHIKQLQKTKFNQVTAKQQRLCLLARALIKNPPLLILDEPCQGLDEIEKEHIKDLIDEICKSGKTTLIYVSHYQDDIPSCINQHLQLIDGKIVTKS